MYLLKGDGWSNVSPWNTWKGMVALSLISLLDQKFSFLLPFHPDVFVLLKFEFSPHLSFKFEFKFECFAHE